MEIEQLPRCFVKEEFRWRVELFADVLYEKVAAIVRAPSPLKAPIAKQDLSSSTIPVAPFEHPAKMPRDGKVAICKKASMSEHEQRAEEEDELGACTLLTKRNLR